jgi:hypothetical protein
MNEKTVEQIKYEQGKIAGKNEVLRALVAMIDQTEDKDELRLLFQVHQKIREEIVPESH